MLGEAVAPHDEDDPVLHEISTPDGDEYREDLLGGDAGPLESFSLDHRRRLAHGFRARIYRFRESLGDDELRRMIASARARVGSRVSATVASVRNSAGDVVDVEEFWGSPRRQGQRAAGRADELGDGRRSEHGIVWFAMENQWDPSSGEVLLNAGEEVSEEALLFVGADRGVARLRGEVAVRRFAPWSPTAGSASGDGEGGRKPTQDSGGVQQSVDAHVLPVVFDEKGERYCPWRDVVPLLVSDEYADWRVEALAWSCG